MKGPHPECAEAAAKMVAAFLRRESERRIKIPGKLADGGNVYARHDRLFFENVAELLERAEVIRGELTLPAIPRDPRLQDVLDA